MNRFRLFTGTLQLEPEPCKNIIHAALLLHNFLIDHGDIPTEDEMRDPDIQNPPNYRPVRAQQQGALIRNKFVDLFTPPCF